MQVKSVVPTPGNSFGASPLRHRPKFARPACLGETVCQAASGHPRAGETLSPGARADAPGGRRLRPTRPPRPGYIARFGRDTVPGRPRGASSTRPPRPGNIARFGRDPARANTGRGSPGLPARTFLAWHRAGGTAPARRARRPPPPIYRFNPFGVVQVKSVVPTPGNSFGASPHRHRPKSARPACLGETVCQDASGHPRAGETLSPGARADAPGERRLRPTRPPRPGNIARFGRDPARANTGRGSPGLPARPHILGLAPGGRDGPGSQGPPTPATHI